MLTTAPWLRGPVLLLQRLGVAGALLAASLVATVPAASAIPFLSSARSATLHHQIAAACPWAVGVLVTSALGAPAPAPGAEPRSPDYGGGLARRTEATNATAATIPLLGPAQTTLLSPLVHGPTERTGDLTYPMYVVHRQGSADHLELVAGSADAGVWVPDAYAEFLGLRAGDDLTVRMLGELVTLSDIAVYRSLREQPHQAWWCDLRSVYGQQAGNTPAPEVIFVDQATYLALPDRVKAQTLHGVAYPLTDPGLDLDAARRVTQRIDSAEAELIEAHQDDAYGGDNNVAVSSRLRDFVGRADLVRESLLQPVAPISAAGALVGLVVVGAAATYWVRRRRHELVMLAAHGVSASALAMKAVAEALPALLAGSVLGWAGAWALVRWAGPDPVLSSEAAPWSAAAAGVTLALAVLTVGLVAGIACRPLADQVRAHHRSVLRRLPYELLVLAAAPLAWRWLGDEAVAESDDVTLGAVVQVPSRLLVVPILVVVGLTVLLARLTVAVLRGPARRWTPRGTASFIGWRRLGRQATMVAILASATSMPVALAVYGAVVTESVRTTIRGEAQLHVGTDVVVLLREPLLRDEADEPVTIPAGLADQATLVRRIDGLRIGGVATDVLVVDPDDFERIAFWHSSLGGMSMHDLLAPLREPSRPTTVIAGGKTPAGEQRVTYGGRDVLGGTVNVVATRVLPAQLGGYSLALVPRSQEGELAKFGRTELWIRGDTEAIMAELAAAGLPIRWIYSAADSYANTLWEPLTYTFDYLIALSLLTGVVTLVGLQLYLEAQTPLRRRAYVLLRRMGLSRGRHHRALLGELALPLLAGLLGGVAMTAGLIAAIGDTFDINPRVLPDTIIDPPYLALGIIGSMTAAVGIVAVSYAQARIGRARPSEVLRDPE